MAKLTDVELEQLTARYGKIGTRDWDGHQLVFRKATRAEVREYRRKQDSAVEKPDAMDQLAQATIVAFDGQQDPNAARTMFTGVFLEQYPAFCSNTVTINILSYLTGIVEEEASTEMGKGGSVRSSTQKNTPSGLTEWLTAIVHGTEPSDRATVAAELTAETLIRLRLALTPKE